MLSETELRDQISKTVTLFNRFHSPEATAKILKVCLDVITVAFSGSFCYSCGVMDLLEDFANKFKLLTDRAGLKIDQTRQTDPRTFEADFKVKYR